MKIIKPSDYTEICDEFRFTVEDDKIDYIEFFLAGKKVLEEYRTYFKKLTLGENSNKLSIISDDMKINTCLNTIKKQIQNDFNQLKIKKIIAAQKN